jgi:hypothetical protein
MRCLSVALLFLAVSPNIGIAQAGQKIMVKLVDGRNGRTLRDQSVAIWLAEKAIGMPNQSVRTNTEGIAFVLVPVQQTSFVIAGESLVDCRMHVRYGKAAMDEAKTYTEEVYVFADVLAHGAVGANKCGKATAQPTPGQLVLFVRPPHWWEKAMWE